VVLNLNRNNFYKVFALQIFIYLFLFLMVSSMGFLLIIDIFIFFILLRILKYELIRITVLSFFLFFFLLVVNIFYSKNPMNVLKSRKGSRKKKKRNKLMSTTFSDFYNKEK